MTSANKTGGKQGVKGEQMQEELRRGLKKEQKEEDQGKAEGLEEKRGTGVQKDEGEQEMKRRGKHSNIICCACVQITWLCAKSIDNQCIQIAGKSVSSLP